MAWSSGAAGSEIGCGCRPRWKNAWFLIFKEKKQLSQPDDRESCLCAGRRSGRLRFP
jgi:hypothetical protein